MVDDELRHDEMSSPGDVLAGAHGVGLGGSSSNDPGRRVEPHGLGENTFEVLEAGKVGRFGNAVSADGLDFGKNALLNLSVPGDEPKQEGECVGGGLVASKEQR